MNVDEWLSYYEVEKEELSYYHGMPCVEEVDEHLNKLVKTIYPSPLVEEISTFMSNYENSKLTYLIYDLSEKKLCCQEQLLFKCDLGEVNCYITHQDDFRSLTFHETFTRTIDQNKASAYNQLFQKMYENMLAFLVEHSPYRLDLLTNTYTHNLPEGVVKASC